MAPICLPDKKEYFEGRFLRITFCGVSVLFSLSPNFEYTVSYCKVTKKEVCFRFSGCDGMGPFGRKRHFAASAATPDPATDGKIYL